MAKQPSGYRGGLLPKGNQPTKGGLAPQNSGSNYPISTGSPDIVLGAPPMGEIVSQAVLEQMVYSGRTWGTLRLAQAYGGVTDPTVIWRSLISDAQDAFYFMRELEEKDEDIGTHLETLKLAVIGQTQNFIPADDSTGADEVATFIQECFQRIPDLHNVLYQLLDAAPYGVSIAEVNYEFQSIKKRQSVCVKSIEDRPQELFTFNPARLPQIGQLRFLRSVYDISGGELVPEDKFIVFSHHMRSGNRRGRAMLRNVFWPSWFKRQTLRLWLRFAEKGPGTAVVKYTSGNSDEAQKALQAAEDIIEKVAVAVPENFDIVHELLNSARATHPDVYVKLVERMETAINRRILGQTLTARGNEGGSGSRSMGRIHQNIFDMFVASLAMALQTAVNDRLVKPLVYWNYGPDAPMPKWNIVPEREEDLSQRITVDSTLQAMGLPISKTYLQEKYNIPDVGEGEDIAEPIPAPAAPVTGVGAGGQGGADAPNSYSEDQKPKNLDDVRRMMAQLKDKSFDTFKARILALTEEARLHQPLV